MKLQNLHTHTKRCNHAQGSEAEYAAAAVATGMRHLGFSDHVPFPDGRWIRERMPLDQLNEYCDAVEEAARKTAKSGLSIYLGLECEYDADMKGYLRDLLDGPRRIGYLVCGIHYFKFGGEWVSAFMAMDSPGFLGVYADTVVEAISSGLFSFVAHPDLFGMSCGSFSPETAACSRAICEAAAAFEVPLEINTSGYRRDPVEWPQGSGRPYPIPSFWEIAASAGVPCLVNTDAHQPKDVAAGLVEGYAIASGLGLDPLFPAELGLIPL